MILSHFRKISRVIIFQIPKKSLAWFQGTGIHLSIRTFNPIMTIMNTANNRPSEERLP